MSASQEAIAEHDERLEVLDARIEALEEKIDRILAHLDPPGTNRALTPRPSPDDKATGT